MQAAKRLLPLLDFWLILNDGTVDSQKNQISGSCPPRQTKPVLAQPAARMVLRMQSGGNCREQRKVPWASCRSS